ncbi:interferon regulatory factor 5 isoform X1 [Larus michahellis]|uniref:interferon regulatory factor 5 isoform X1 n=1 Tax=Larus michahellis TaxID=119627 RepID=UPI003D9BE575
MVGWWWPWVWGGHGVAGWWWPWAWGGRGVAGQEWPWHGPRRAADVRVPFISDRPGDQVPVPGPPGLCPHHQQPPRLPPLPQQPGAHAGAGGALRAADAGAGPLPRHRRHPQREATVLHPPAAGRAGPRAHPGAAGPGHLRHPPLPVQGLLDGPLRRPPRRPQPHREGEEDQALQPGGLSQRPHPVPEGADHHPPALRDLLLLRRGVARPEAQGEKAHHGAGGAGGGAVAAGDVLGRVVLVGRQHPPADLPPRPQGQDGGAVQGAPPALAEPAAPAPARPRALVPAPLRVGGHEGHHLGLVELGPSTTHPKLVELGPPIAIPSWWSWDPPSTVPILGWWSWCHPLPIPSWWSWDHPLPIPSWWNWCHPSPIPIPSWWSWGHPSPIPSWWSWDPPQHRPHPGLVELGPPIAIPGWWNWGHPTPSPSWAGGAGATHCPSPSQAGGAGATHRHPRLVELGPPNTVPISSWWSWGHPPPIPSWWNWDPPRHRPHPGLVELGPSTAHPKLVELVPPIAHPHPQLVELVPPIPILGWWNWDPPGAAKHPRVLQGEGEEEPTLTHPTEALPGAGWEEKPDPPPPGAPNNAPHPPPPHFLGRNGKKTGPGWAPAGPPRSSGHPKPPRRTRSGTWGGGGGVGLIYIFFCRFFLGFFFFLVFLLFLRWLRTPRSPPPPNGGTRLRSGPPLPRPRFPPQNQIKPKKTPKQTKREERGKKKIKI